MVPGAAASGSRRGFVIGFLLLLGFFGLHLRAGERSPNLLVILADDLGWGDLGVQGSRHLKTPHLDQLAAKGVRCLQGYVASPVCSPSRAGMLTGRDPRRFGYQANLNQNASQYPTRPEWLGLPQGEHTLGDHLRAAGYATALVGKWHLGTEAVFHPNQRGMDHFCGMLTGSHGYFPQPGKHSLERNGNPVESFSSAYLTDFFTDEGIRWIQERHGKSPDQPWFLFMSYNAPHTPMQATEEDLAKFSHIRDSRRRTYAAMVWALDRGVGRLIETLKHLKLEKDTLIVFLSDNGGATSNASWNGPLSGAKGSLREGGVRVPMIWHFPGVLPEGRVHDFPVSSLDLAPTFLKLAGKTLLPLSPPRVHEDAGNRRRMVQEFGAYDGRDVLPELAGKVTPEPRTLHWRLQGQAAILHHELKLIRPPHRPAQLFDPRSDPGESKDLALAHPEALGDLFKRLAHWEALLPTVPLWGSSPRWSGDSSRIYDQYLPKPEPE